MNSLVESIKEKVSRKREYNIYDTVVLIKDPLPKTIDFQNTIDELKKTIPSSYFSLIDVIYIGKFDFEKDGFTGKYMDGAIYLTNDQDDAMDIVDDVIHEISHALEDSYGGLIYGDGSIIDEFLSKRKVLERYLRHTGFDTSELDFRELNYDKKLDDFLFKKVGYDYINKTFSGNLFLNAYSITNLREYFAIGFEKYYMESRREIDLITPKLYEKLVELENYLEDN